MPPDRSRPGDPIRRVLVVGGGIVARSAAATFKRKMPWLDVALLPTATDPAALADTMVPTLPSIGGFHADLGLSDADSVGRTGSALRLGTMFAGWADCPAEYVHAYGPYGQAVGATAFHLQWARLAGLGQVQPFDHYSPAAMLARAGRIAPDHARDFECGLQLNPARYTAMLDAFCRHCGVRVEHGQPARVVRGADDFISRVVLDNGHACEADLFVDAGGPAALLRQDRHDDWQDWSMQPGCDRMIRVAGPPPAELPLHDTVTAFAAGWHWSAATAEQADYGICYASALCDDETAARVLADACAILPNHAPVAIRAGTHRIPWRGNCVAIGDAATAIEPLEWTNLHLAHSAIDRIIAMLPDARCAPVELAEYNRQAHAEAIRVRDFIVMHYATARRGEPFWRHAAQASLPATLAHTLALFRERGRLPVHAEETFARDSWLAVLFGQGERPARVDPLAALTPLPEAARAIAGIDHAIRATLPQSPSYAAMRAAQSRPVAS